MIVDSSALVAIVRGEDAAEELLAAILSADACRISAATYVEASVVIDARRSPTATRRFDELMATTPIEVVELTAAQATIAREAYRDFGRGSGHRANLNFGDCFSYALAIDRREPLLYVGDDFVHTDVRSALDS